ncbi:hypothetical protein [Streptomyces sp. NPDC056672]|uniref:hypothetical protein n=1 Tax=Streptomyces sp. NPDC056672 TaxID=3345906 RepID=UPI0036C31151
MPTTYPVTLPAVPDDPESAWRAERIGTTAVEHPGQGWPSATTTYAIDATGPHEAELRLLAWINHSYQDDLRNATATAINENTPGHWHVSLRLIGEF